MTKLISKKHIEAYLKLIRFQQPAGIFLLLWPCLISLSLASKGYPNPILVLVFIIGSILMRSAGCIINDLVDYQIDRKVERTKTRPLANGTINRSQAIKLLICLLILSSILLLFFNKLAALISLLSIPLVILYPFCKRFTYWPQLCLGLVYNLGALIAWATIRDEINLPAILLYIGFVFWTLGYDTIYAHQDREDDLKIGVKSTAIQFGEDTEKYLNYFYTITATMIVFAGGVTGINLYYYSFLSLPIGLLFWQIKTLDIDNKSNCAIRFKINVLVGGLIWLAILISKWYSR